MFFGKSREKELRMILQAESHGRRSFLVGTAHFFPYSFRDSFVRLFHDAGTVLFEGPLDEENMAAVVRAGSGEADSTHLFDALDRATIARITDAIAPVCKDRQALLLFDILSPRVENPAYAMVKGMRPWLAFFTLFSRFLQKKGWKHSVDMEAYQVATKMGKNIVFLESIEEQIEVLESLDHDRIIDFLRRIEHWDRYTDRYADWYLAGDLEKIKSNPFGFPTRHPLVIDHRDETLWERLKPHVQQGGAVACLGAPHLVGVGTLMRSEGYAVEMCQGCPDG
jgi:uncharacterized protein YbaP (TraB family)